MNMCCELAVWDSATGWWCEWHGDADETYATLQAEQLAAADVDWDAREMSD